LPEGTVSAEQTNSPKLSRTERRKLAALGIQAGKSNRTIANEIDCDEGTIRRDLKALLPPVKQPHVKTPYKIKNVRLIKRAGRSVSGEVLLGQMLEVVKTWFTKERLLIPDIEYILDKADKLLHLDWGSIKDYQAPTKGAAELFSMTRPPYPVEDYMPAKLEFYGDWLARWIACCLPRKAALQKQLFQELLLWTRSRE
jgi:hypothetical protein